MADQVISLAEVLTIPGAALITWILVQATKKPIPPDWTPLYAIGVGIVVTLAATFAVDQLSRTGIGLAVLIGIQAGAIAIAGNEIVSRAAARIRAR